MDCADRDPPSVRSFAWKPIATAPMSGARYVQPYAFGPFLWLRAGRQEAWGRWRSGVAIWDRLTGARTSTPGRWEGPDGEPLAFMPEEWSV